MNTNCSKLKNSLTHNCSILTNICFERNLDIQKRNVGKQTLKTTVKNSSLSTLAKNHDKETNLQIKKSLSDLTNFNRTDTMDKSGFSISTIAEQHSENVKISPTQSVFSKISSQKCKVSLSDLAKSNSINSTSQKKQTMLSLASLAESHKNESDKPSLKQEQEKILSLADLASKHNNSPRRNLSARVNYKSYTAIGLSLCDLAKKHESTCKPSVNTQKQTSVKNIAKTRNVLSSNNLTGSPNLLDLSIAHCKTPPNRLKTAPTEKKSKGTTESTSVISDKTPNISYSEPVFLKFDDVYHVPFHSAVAEISEKGPSLFGQTLCAYLIQRPESVKNVENVRGNFVGFDKSEGIVTFSFDTESPDDIIRKKQKAAFNS